MHFKAEDRSPDRSHLRGTELPWHSFASRSGLLKAVLSWCAQPDTAWEKIKARGISLPDGEAPTQ